MLSALLLAALSTPAPAADVAQILRERLPALVAFYKELHAAPELSLHEEKSSARLADELRKLGYAVTEHVGGYGVVGVLENGPGRTLLVRCDMDALPVEEKTSLPYASHVKAQLDGKEVPVMHACGHDMHMSVWLGTAEVLARTKEQWKGKLILIAQPAEEKGVGAQAMLADKLFERFGKPDGCLALHVSPFFAAGTVALCPGYALANAESCDIVVHGRGSHGSMPHLSIDPIVIASKIVLGLQTIISREKDPRQPGVITVGSFHSGTKHNIIPDDAHLQLTIRSYDDKVHQALKDGIVRVSQAEAGAAGAPEPEVTFSEAIQSTYNDPVWCAHLQDVLGNAIGSRNVFESEPVMGAEDFGLFGRAGVPAVMFWLGAPARARLEEAKKSGEVLPGLHTQGFAPDPEPALEAGVLAMSAAVSDAFANGIPAQKK
ncbi:MAG: amidohydrolase [Planctomycetes bacterium]|nr:amidohydrolase [Planctomycetota bacterium]